MSLPKSSASVR